jgi:hypothetical protein
LAVIGAGYLVFAVLQWQVLRWAFLADRRPRLGIRRIALVTDPNEILTPDHEGHLVQNNLEVQLSLINRGGSPAQIIEGNVTLTIDKINDVESIAKKTMLLPPFDVKKGSPVYSEERDMAADVIVRPAEPHALTMRMPISGSAYDAAETYLAIHPERNLKSVALHVFGYFKYQTPLESAFASESYLLHGLLPSLRSAARKICRNERTRLRVRRLTLAMQHGSAIR